MTKYHRKKYFFFVSTVQMSVCVKRLYFRWTEKIFFHVFNSFFFHIIFNVQCIAMVHTAKDRERQRESDGMLRRTTEKTWKELYCFATSKRKSNEMRKKKKERREKELWNINKWFIGNDLSFMIMENDGIHRIVKQKTNSLTPGFQLIDVGTRLKRSLCTRTQFHAHTDRDIVQSHATANWSKIKLN